MTCHGIRTLLALAAVAALLALTTWPAAAEPWPYQPFDQTHGVGNHYGEFQDYGGGAYYHDGIDLVTPDGPVNTYSVSAATCTHLTFNDPLYSGIMIGEPVNGGLGWLYWHINSTTFQYDIGDAVPLSAYIGRTANWPVAQFHHTHFNRVRGTGGYPWGWYQAIDNPLLYMVPNTDPDPPIFKITNNGKLFAFARQGTGTVLDPASLSGDVDIISRIDDVVGLPQWLVNPWKIDYWIDGATQSVPRTNTVTFSGVIPADNTVSVIYRTTSPMQTKGDYNQRIYYFIVTNTDGDGTVESSDANYSWQTGGFRAGDYWVHIEAADIGGNVVEASMLATVAGAVNPDIALPETAHDFGRVPPGVPVHWQMSVENLGVDPLSVRDIVSSSPAFTVDRTHFFVLPDPGVAIVDVTFTPSIPFTYNGTLTITSNDPDEPSVVVAVTGIGLQPNAVEEDAAGAGSFRLVGARTLPGRGAELLYEQDREGSVALKVYDIAGRQVFRTLLPQAAAGSHRWMWDGQGLDGRRVASGTYYIHLMLGDRFANGSTVLLN